MAQDIQVPSVTLDPCSRAVWIVHGCGMRLSGEMDGELMDGDRGWLKKDDGDLENEMRKAESSGNSIGSIGGQSGGGAPPAPFARR